MYSKTGICSDGRSPTAPGCTARTRASRPLVLGMSLASTCCATLKTSRPSGGDERGDGRARTMARLPGEVRLGVLRHRGHSSRGSPAEGPCDAPDRAEARCGRRRARRGRRRTGRGPARARRAGSAARSGAGWRAVTGCGRPRWRDCRLAARAGSRGHDGVGGHRGAGCPCARSPADARAQRRLGRAGRRSRPVGFITDRDLALSVVADGATRRASAITPPRRSSPRSRTWTSRRRPRR